MYSKRILKTLIYEWDEYVLTICSCETLFRTYEMYEMPRFIFRGLVQLFYSVSASNKYIQGMHYSVIQKRHEHKR